MTSFPQRFPSTEKVRSLVDDHCRLHEFNVPENAVHIGINSELNLLIYLIYLIFLNKNDLVIEVWLVNIILISLH